MGSYSLKTEVIQVHPEFPDLNVMARCAKVIRKGGLVIFPTETVYGIAADMTNQKVMTRLRELKQRAEDKPFSMLVHKAGMISDYTSLDSTALYKLIHKYWPGPLTVVVPCKDNEEGKTIGIRMPDNLIALKLVQESNCPVAAPSANLDGKPPPSTCDAALQDLDGEVEIALDGGAAAYSQPSTVVDLSKGSPVVLREGVISTKDIEYTAKRKTIVFVCTGNSCRSVMAEYLFKDQLKQRDDVEVFSAGTSVFLHSSASAQTIALLKERGLDVTEHISQSVDNISMKKSDLILVMTNAHRAQVISLVPQLENRIYLLKGFSQGAQVISPELDIPDPMGGSVQMYKECFGMIDEAVQKVEALI